MSVGLRLRFFNSNSLGEPGSLKAVLSAIQSEGFYVSKLRATNYQDETYWDHTPAQILEVLPLAYANRRLMFNARNQRVGFEVFLQLFWAALQSDGPQESFIGAVCFQTQLFSNEVSQAEFYSEVFLNLGKSLYNVLSPDFGWLDYGDPAGHTSDRDVMRLALPHVYWANFLGPSFVNKLGREHIQSAPGWLIERFDDGGMLYVVTSALGFAGENRGTLEDARSHFGAASIG